jgi:hypothetical protein
MASVFSNMIFCFTKQDTLSTPTILSPIGYVTRSVGDEWITFLNIDTSEAAGSPAALAAASAKPCPAFNPRAMAAPLPKTWSFDFIKDPRLRKRYTEAVRFFKCLIVSNPQMNLPFMFNLNR